MYKILKASEILELSKENLLKQVENIEILEQSQYSSIVSALQSLKTESFILFKNIDNSSLYIAKTEYEEIRKILNIDEFKESISKLPSYEKKKLVNIVNRIEQESQLNKVKNT